MQNCISGIEIIEKSEKQERSQVTGQILREPSGVHNNLTGMYDKEEDVALRKACGVRWPSLVGESVEKSDGDTFECFTPFIKADTMKQIVYGIVYSPDEVDSQGDEASAEEIEKAAHQFLAECRVMKVMHRGKPAKVEVIESYVAPEDFTLGKQKITKGSWVVAVHVTDKKIWKAIIDGELNGFSMAGHAVTAA